MASRARYGPQARTLAALGRNVQCRLVPGNAGWYQFRGQGAVFPTLVKVRTMVTERVNGRNGKSYRARALTTAQKIALLTAVHYLRHVEHMSVRAIAMAVEQQNGEKLSVGAVHEYLSMQSYGIWHCGVCQVEES